MWYVFLCTDQWWSTLYQADSLPDVCAIRAAYALITCVDCWRVGTHPLGYRY
jgi:hypothetical protein